MKYPFTLAFIMFALYGIAQDTLKVMQYNLMYYGQTSSFCTTSNNSESAKNGYLKTIIKYVKPDIFTVNEMAPNSIKHQSLLSNCLNVDGVTYYNKCNLSNVSGSDLSNELYYNSEKLGFVSQVNIATSIRDINIYKLYYKAWNLSTTHDTAYVTCIVVDLKAGNTPSDETERATETTALINYLSSVGVKDNYMAMGDFNVYTGTEQCYQNLLNPANQNIKFNDPINQIGNWHSNPSYASIHTQSTHTTSTGCFVTGGLDDRFDQILISDNIKNGSDHFQYFTGSYTTIGQDGNHMNDSLTHGINNSAPDSVIEALYGMSDHLPITLMLRVNQTVGYSDVQHKTIIDLSFENPVKGDMPLTIQLSKKTNINLSIMNMLGQELYSNVFESSDIIIHSILPTNELNSGIYFLKITDNANNSIVKKIIKE